uniref:HDC01528 n=1 Tax=Drosophila melanogaster TaxID=7227 RepID=Q6IHR1_DROME|nr:TPA_inf: HDC01528 [Drosophila melanogaster]
MSATNADDAALQRCRDEKCHYSRSHINLRIDLPTLFHINRYLYGIFMANLLAGIPAQPQPHPPRLIHRILSPVFCALHPQSATPSQNPGGKKVHATLAHHHYVGCGPDGRKGLLYRKNSLIKACQEPETRTQDMSADEHFLKDLQGCPSHVMLDYGCTCTAILIARTFYTNGTFLCL